MKSNSRAGKRVIRKRRFLSSANNVIRLDAFPLEEQIGFADGVGLGINFLAEQVNGDFLTVRARQAQLGDSSATVSMPPVPQAPS